MTKDKEQARTPELPFANYTTATGLALGELLLFTGRPEYLELCLHSIGLSARAILLASGLKWVGKPPEGGKEIPLHSAALAVVTAWHERTDDLSALGESIAALEEILEGIGLRYVAP